jgi:hypothetical protein
VLFAKNLAVLAHSQKTLRFAQNLCTSWALSENLAVFALSQKALRFAQNLCASLKIFPLSELLSKTPCFYQNPHAFSKHALVWQKHVQKRHAKIHYEASCLNCQWQLTHAHYNDIQIIWEIGSLPVKYE